MKTNRYFSVVTLGEIVHTVGQTLDSNLGSIIIRKRGKTIKMDLRVMGAALGSKARAITNW